MENDGFARFLKTFVEMTALTGWVVSVALAGYSFACVGWFWEMPSLKIQIGFAVATFMWGIAALAYRLVFIRPQPPLG